MITREERDRLYTLMNAASAELNQLRSPRGTEPWILSSSDGVPEEAQSLWCLFHGMNRHQHHRWFRLLMRHPHFPGEDLTPDTCPLVEAADGTYSLESQIKSVEIRRIKTFFQRASIEVVEESLVGTLRFDESIASKETPT